ncbi:hypothetical protein K2Z84_03335 [Candidatus Binatia bacterium]|nr:hypothetical protein [Candidatus Binatia bacterium]
MSDDTTRPAPAGKTGDALSLFLTSRRSHSGPVLVGAKPFESGEHIWLGGKGADLACQMLDKEGHGVFDKSIFASIKRLHSNDRLSYGELVALSGDFYETPEELFEEKPALLPWLWEDHDLSDLRDIFGQELAWIEDQHRGPGGYPDNNIRMAWNAKGYVELALRNTSHFGWHNMVAYVTHHATALDLARQANGQSNDTWRRALFTNAFADHFLTDGFAAGHVRVPRAAIREWALDRGYSDKLAGALSKVLHDQDGHIDTLHSAGEGQLSDAEGLRVLNAAGDSWFARCDGQLFMPRKAADTPAVQMTVHAVAESVRELLLAWREQTLPAGPYAATRLVPFPHPDAPKLIDKFSPSMPEPAFQKLVDSVKWYTKIPWIGPGLGADEIRALFASLPGIMQQFRAIISVDLNQDQTLTERLAPGYVTGFRNIA